MCKACFETDGDAAFAFMQNHSGHEAIVDAEVVISDVGTRLYVTIDREKDRPKLPMTCKGVGVFVRYAD